MKKLKQVLTFTLAAALAASTMGCANGNTSSKVSTTSSTATDYSKAKAETLTVFSETSNFSGTQGGWYAKVLKDKFNVTLKIISGQGDGANLYNTRSASGDLGDLVVYGSNIQHFSDSIKAGLLTDMTDLLKTDGQYITKNYSSAVNRIKKDYGDDKAIYGLPNNVSTNSATESADGPNLNFGNFMLWSAYKAAGSPQISTLEDIIPALQKMQTARPKGDNGKQTYGFSLFKDWDGNMMSNIKQYACLYGWDEWGFLLVNADASKYESLLDDNGQYYRNLKLYFSANKLGLLDPDSYAQTYDDFALKLKNGQVLSSWWQWAAQGQYNTVDHTASANSVASTGVKGADGYVVIPIADEQVISTGFSPEGANFEVAIGNKCTDKNRAMALINWMYSPEGMETQLDGPKGLTWELKDGKPVLTDFGKKATADDTVAVTSEYGGGTYHDGEDQFGINGVNSSATDPTFNEPYMYSLWASAATASTDLMKEWSSTIANGATGSHDFLQASKQMVVVPGTAVQTPVLTTDVSAQQAAVAAIIKKYSWNMVMTKSDTDFAKFWNAMKTEAKSAGIDDVDKAYVAQYQLLKTAREEAVSAK